MLDSCKIVEKQSEAFHTFLWHFFPSLKHNFVAYCSSKVSSYPDCIFEIHQLWQSGFSRVYSNSCCSGSFEREIIKIGQSFHKMCSNNVLNLSRVYNNSKCLYKKSQETYWRHHVFVLTSFVTGVSGYFTCCFSHLSCCYLQSFALSGTQTLFVYSSRCFKPLGLFGWSGLLNTLTTFQQMGKPLVKECPGYNTKQSDGETLLML